MNYFINIAYFTISVVASTYFSCVLWDLGKVFFGYHVVGADLLRDDPLNSVLTDLGLICLFIGQHKLFGIINKILRGTMLEPLCRSIFLISTSLALQLIIKYWAPTPKHIVWDFSTVLPNWLFPCVHILLFILLFLQLIMMDLPLFLGIKQVWYYIKGWSDPMLYKSMGYQRYLNHSSHPMLALLLVLWLRSVMRVDLFILACGLSAYSTQKTVDQHDFVYVERQTRLSTMKWQ